MAQFIKFSGSWINLDYVGEFYIHLSWRKEGQKFMLTAVMTDPFSSFGELYDTREQAEERLNKLINGVAEETD